MHAWRDADRDARTCRDALGESCDALLRGAHYGSGKEADDAAHDALGQRLGPRAEAGLGILWTPQAEDVIEVDVLLLLLLLLYSRWLRHGLACKWIAV